jgi:uncharacterized protein (DUF1810 family)
MKIPSKVDRAMSLERFVSAQRNIYDQALGELKRGHKTSHWMWYIFPQLAGLGRSPTARFFGIANKDGAVAYLAHPTLGTRLAECTDAVMPWTSRRNITMILGATDALKFCSAMTLFEAAGAPFCAPALNAFYDGNRDERTLALLAHG